MSFFKSLFGKKEPEIKRKLDHPSQLQSGDIFTCSDSFALPSVMRKQQFQVNKVETIEFEHQHYAQITAQGSGQQPLYLSFPTNPQQFIKLSLLLTRDQVESLFDLEQFSEIFEEPGKARLKVTNLQHEYADMIAKEYIQQAFMVTGYKHSDDYRNSTPPQYNEQKHGREFEFYSLQGGQEQRFIDIVVFENGDTEVYLSFLRPANDIAELWIKGE